MGQFSPDGRFVAYQSRQGGRLRKEIFCITGGGGISAAEVFLKGDTLQLGAVKPLFGAVGTGGYGFAVSADGQRFLTAIMPQQPENTPLTLVQNWLR